MAEPFKNFINEQLISDIGLCIQSNWSAFDAGAFTQMTVKDLDQYEMKERCFRMVESLEVYLPDDFVQAADILLRSLQPEECCEDAKAQQSSGLHGWAIMAIQEYVGRNGLDHFGVSLNLLKEMTKRLTSEFGIRYFIETYQLETLKTMQVWVKDPNEHVRRLVSEGTRPRLPWGKQLKALINDPTPIIPLLDVLKDDPAEYVRRSVANNLNDIAKDHPEMVCKIAKSWMVDASPNRIRLIKHALRTLVKKGNSEALAILGFETAKIENVSLSISSSKLNVGEILEIKVSMTSISNQPQPMIIDYAIHYQKANGSMRPKVFKWKNFELKPSQTILLKKRHALRDVSVRKHYAGGHAVEILINGKSYGTEPFEVLR